MQGSWEDSRMRIVSWNCARGPLDAKLNALHSLHPDVAVICEAPAPGDPSNQVIWFPTEVGQSRLGIQVRAYGEYALERLPRAPGLPACVNPVRVTGPMHFNLLAVWTWPTPSYLSALVNGLDAYAHLFAEPTVIAGDFNGNPCFDKPRQRSKWVDAFARINELGSVSAYHHTTEVSYGNERDPTHHHRKNPQSPFHIDFCFVPSSWCGAGVEATVAHGEPWTSISDHFPLLVDVATS